MSHIGRNTSRVASSENPSREDRAAVREALGPVVESLLHDLTLVRDALDGPDPEYALSLYVDLAHEATARLRRVEEGLSASHRLSVAA